MTVDLTLTWRLWQGDSGLHMVPDWEAAQHCDAPDCDCEPECQTLCPECDGDGCWHCEAGLVPASPGEAPDVIIHNALKDAP